jgi:hypothetical protein
MPGSIVLKYEGRQSNFQAQSWMIMKPNYDGVIEAVHYSPNGMIDTVRLYERRGATFSDRVLVKRDALVKGILSGKKFVTGRRTENMGSVFEHIVPVRLIEDGGNKLVTNDKPVHDHDTLGGTPRY